MLKLSAQVTKGGGGTPQFCLLFYANYTILATQRGGRWPNARLNTPLTKTASYKFFYPIKIEKCGEEISATQTCHRGGIGAEPPAAEQFFVIFWKKMAILM